MKRFLILLINIVVINVLYSQNLTKTTTNDTTNVGYFIYSDLIKDTLYYIINTKIGEMGSV